MMDHCSKGDSKGVSPGRFFVIVLIIPRRLIAFSRDHLDSHGKDGMSDVRFMDFEKSFSRNFIVGIVGRSGRECDASNTIRRSSEILLCLAFFFCF